MRKRLWENQTLALGLAPVVSTLPLILFFGIPSSPLFLEKLMGNVPHPVGPVLSSMAVVFDGTILAYLLLMFPAVPLYLALKGNGKLSARNVVIVFSLIGILGSQFVRLFTQGFREPALRDFSNSWLSPLAGCLCGLVAGAFVADFANRSISPPARAFMFPVPLAVMFLCAVALMGSAGARMGH